MMCTSSETVESTTSYPHAVGQEGNIRHKSMEPLKALGEIDELDQYVFVIRGRIG